MPLQKSEFFTLFPKQKKGRAFRPSFFFFLPQKTLTNEEQPPKRNRADGGGGGSDAAGGDAGGVVQRYRRRYLARLNPFAAFREREVEDSASSLPIHDRIGLTSGKMLMKSRATRTAFSVYLIVLHLFMLRRAFS